MLETDAQLYEAEATLLVLLVCGVALAWLVRTLAGHAPGVRLAWIAAAAFGVRVLTSFSFALLGSTGDELRTDDDQLFLNQATRLSELPLTDKLWPDIATGEFHVALFAGQMKLLAGAGGTPLRITQAAVATAAVLLAAAAVHRLAGPRAALLVGWFLALEPSSVLFTTILQKEALVLLGEGLILIGLAASWSRRDLSGLPFVTGGAALALLTRPYAGIFLVGGVVLVYAYLLWTGLGSGRRRPGGAAVLVAALCVAGLGAAISANALERLQGLQEHPLDANTNLQLDPVDFGSLDGIATGVPTRVFDFMFRPFPWQAENASQALGVIGTLITWSLYALLVVSLWRAKPEARARAVPFLVLIGAVVLCYALSTVNAGTGFRHRLHLLVPLAGCIATLGVVIRPEAFRALRHGAAGAALMAVIVLATGCGGDSGAKETTSPGPAVAVELQGRDTPRRAVNRYLSRVKARSLPLALAQYEPRVRRALGLTVFAGVLEFCGYSLTSVEPAVVAAREDGRQASVVVRARRYSLGRRLFEFELVRRGRWRIVRDDITQIAVRRYAEIGEQHAIRPGVQISPVAKRRARRFVRIYRAAARSSG